MATRVFIGRLSYDVRERDLEKFFKGYGRIREIVIKNGFGFVEFEDYRDADDAVYELNGKQLMGERVSVEHARGSPRVGGGGGGGGGDRWNNRNRRGGFPRRQMGRDRYGPPTRTKYRLIVENLSSGVSWQGLKDYVRQAGEVTYADAHKQRRNEGIVELATYADMKNAVEKLDNTELNGRRIRLVEDKSRRSFRSNSKSRSRSPSRSRTNSRSRSRSQSKSRSASKSRSRSKSPSKSRSASPEHKNSPPKSRSSSREKSRSRSKSQSPEKSPEKDGESPKSENQE